ncbi:hypothetical protein ISN36_12070 [Xanthomonas translucens pv. undulosa]|nr:hypothetical protein ISN36_12070 [Xanthomonas translucens pv. undulosa]
MQDNMINVVEEVRRGPLAESLEFIAESIEQCMGAVKRLNGLDRTVVSFSSGNIMVMVGGGDGIYVVSIETPKNLINVVNLDAEEDEVVDVTVGGQACEYPRYYVVKLSQVGAALQDHLFGIKNEEVEYEIIPK